MEIAIPARNALTRDLQYLGTASEPAVVDAYAMVRPVPVPESSGDLPDQVESELLVQVPRVRILFNNSVELHYAVSQSCGAGKGVLHQRPAHMHPAAIRIHGIARIGNVPASPNVVRADLVHADDPPVRLCDAAEIERSEEVTRLVVGHGILLRERLAVHDDAVPYRGHGWEVLFRIGSDPCFHGHGIL